MYCRMLLALLLPISWMISTDHSSAQRVQFPSAAPTYGTAAPTFTPPTSTFDPYGNPLLGTPPVDVPYNVTPQPQLTQPQFGQQILPPGSAVAVPPQSGGSFFPNGLPFQWEQGAYQYENSDGQFARLQRFLQQISFEHTWIYGNDDLDKLEINRTEIAATFGVPIFYNPNTPLLITPGFAFNWLEGPSSSTPVVPGVADLPPRVYDAYLDTAWHPQLTDWLHVDLGLRTGVWSDFDNVNSDSVRFLGRGLGVLGFSPHLDFLVGVWYLDRNSVKLMPAGGIHWRPDTIWDAYLVFPNPKIRRRSINVGSSQWWCYAAGEYGGGRWTVQRVGGPDDIDYNDLRFILGYEWETQTQARGHIEVAYVWDREILFDQSKSPAKFNLSNTVMVRVGVDF